MFGEEVGGARRLRGVKGRGVDDRRRSNRNDDGVTAFSRLGSCRCSAGLDRICEAVHDHAAEPASRSSVGQLQL